MGTEIAPDTAAGLSQPECGGRGNPLDVTRAAAPAFLSARGSDTPGVPETIARSEPVSIASGAGLEGEEKGRER